MTKSSTFLRASEHRAVAAIVALCALALVSPACSGPVDGDPTDPDRELPPTIVVDRDPIGSVDDSAARRVRRLTAEQWNASLTVATGQEWSDWDENADALGRPDFTMVTDEGEQMSVVFEQLIGDAARETCGLAVRADRALAAGEERVILGSLDLDAAEPAARIANLRRLLLRFHGHDVARDDDARVTPWRELLEAPLDRADLGSAVRTDADVEALRWEAICIGLATHSDFLTY
ncbi:MAG: hypothetical protein M3Y87_03565 [Myxococcota bacterium]|nr:hypothetical protein [Myxococcota bacterium]